jgi:hypothetical protein
MSFDIMQFQQQALHRGGLFQRPFYHVAVLPFEGLPDAPTRLELLGSYYTDFENLLILPRHPERQAFQKLRALDHQQ